MSSRVLKVVGVSPYVNVRGQFVQTPSIRIQGKWVEKLGFQVGARVEVIEKDSEITLKILEDEEGLHG